MPMQRLLAKDNWSGKVRDSLLHLIGSENTHGMTVSEPIWRRIRMRGGQGTKKLFVRWKKIGAANVSESIHLGGVLDPIRPRL